MDEVSREVGEGRDVIQSAGAALEEIVKGAENTAVMIQQIKEATEEQIAGTKQVVKSVDDIASTAEESAAATEEASASTEEMTASMEEMAASAQELAEMAEPYAAVSQAIKKIAKHRIDLVQPGSLASLIESLPNPVTHHAFPHWKIYFNQHFIDLTKLYSEETRYSVALSSHRLLTRFSLDLTDENIAKAVDFVLEKRRKISNKIIFSKGVNVINVVHTDIRFDLKGLIALEKSAGVRSPSIVNYRGKDKKEKILKSIKKSKGASTFYFNTHGSRSRFFLHGGEIGEQEANSPPKSLNISFEELGDALLQRGDLGNVVIIDDMCFSHNYSLNLLNYLAGKGSKELPFILTSANYNRLGYGYELLFMLQKNQEVGQPITAKYVMESEKGSFALQDPAMFDMLTDGDWKVLKELFPTIKSPTILLPTSFFELSNPQSKKILEKVTPNDLTPKSMEIGSKDIIQFAMKAGGVVTSVALIGLLAIGLLSPSALATPLLSSLGGSLPDPMLILGAIFGSAAAYGRIKDRHRLEEETFVDSAIEVVATHAQSQLYNLFYHAAKESMGAQKKVGMLHLKGLYEVSAGEMGEEITVDIPEAVKEMIEGTIHSAQLNGGEEKPQPKLVLIIDSDKHEEILKALKENIESLKDVDLFSVQTPEEAIKISKREDLKISFIFTFFPEEWPKDLARDLIALLMELGELRIRGALATRLYQAMERTGFVDIEKVTVNRNEIVIPAREIGIQNIHDLWKEKLTFKTHA